jgi:hypothetical protein
MRECIQCKELFKPRKDYWELCPSCAGSKFYKPPRDEPEDDID